MPKAQISTNGFSLTIHYELFGKGPEKVIFIMGTHFKPKRTIGLHFPLEAWEAQYEYFKDKEQFQICVFDNRGAGRSTSPFGRYSTLDMANDTLGLLEHLGWTHHVHVVGSSLGSMIAQELVVLKPEMFRSVVFISTHMGYFFPAMKLLKKLPQASFIWDEPTKVNCMLDFIFTQEWMNSTPEDTEHETNRDFVHSKFMSYNNQFKQLTLTGQLGQITAISTHRMTKERLQKVLDYSIHFLVIVGEKDEVFSPESSVQLSKILNCKLESMKDMGHGLALEKKHVVNPLIESHFLEASKLSNGSFASQSSEDTLI